MRLIFKSIGIFLILFLKLICSHSTEKYRFKEVIGNVIHFLPNYCYLETQRLSIILSETNPIPNEGIKIAALFQLC